MPILRTDVLRQSALRNETASEQPAFVRVSLRVVKASSHPQSNIPLSSDNRDQSQNPHKSVVCARKAHVRRVHKMPGRGLRLKTHISDGKRRRARPAHGAAQRPAGHQPRGRPGSSEGCPAADVTEAYRDMAILCHPDKVAAGLRGDAGVAMSRLNASARDAAPEQEPGAAAAAAAPPRRRPERDVARPRLGRRRALRARSGARPPPKRWLGTRRGQCVPQEEPRGRRFIHVPRPRRGGVGVVARRRRHDAAARGRPRRGRRAAWRGSGSTRSGRLPRRALRPRAGGRAPPRRGAERLAAMKAQAAARRVAAARAGFRSAASGLPGRAAVPLRSRRLLPLAPPAAAPPAARCCRGAGAEPACAEAGRTAAGPTARRRARPKVRELRGRAAGRARDAARGAPRLSRTRRRRRPLRARAALRDEPAAEAAAAGRGAARRDAPADAAGAGG